MDNYTQVNMRRRMERMGLSREDNDGTAGGAGEDTSSSNGGETPHRVRHAARRDFVLYYC